MDGNLVNLFEMTVHKKSDTKILNFYVESFPKTFTRFTSIALGTVHPFFYVVSLFLCRVLHGNLVNIFGNDCT